jgi:hypothetical protein
MEVRVENREHTATPPQFRNIQMHSTQVNTRDTKIQSHPSILRKEIFVQVCRRSLLPLRPGHPPNYDPTHPVLSSTICKASITKEIKLFASAFRQDGEE